MIITNSNTKNKIISPKSRSDYSLSPERDEPYHLSLDKDDYFHLPSEMDEVYYSLLRTLKRKKGFGLFFVVLSSPIKISKVITRLQKDLSQKTIHDLEIDRQATRLYDQIAEVYRQTKCDILCFKNLESALYDYEDTKRLSGWSEEEAYAYSWKGVPPILNHLNQQRERLSRDFPFSLVFFVPSFAIDYLIQRAPDFFDWRSGVFRFPFTDQELSEQLTEFIQGDLDIYLSFTPEQRVETILGIRDLILAADRDAEATSKLYFEQSLLFLSGNQYNKAIERLNKVIELQPNNYNALVYKSFILIKCERYNEALICLDRIIELKFSQSVEIKPNDYQIWAVHGDVLRKLERYEESLVSYDRAININSDDYRVWTVRSDVLDTLEHYEEALIGYDRAININSNDYKLWAVHGDALRKLERYEEALVSYDRAIDINSDDYKVWAVRGDVLDTLERYEEALISYDRAININSDDYRLWRMRGDVLETLERYEEALVSYNGAIEVQPNDDISWNNYGAILANNNRYDEALLYFHKAIELKPNESQYLSNLARLLQALKRCEEAIEIYKKAIRIDKRSTSFYNSLSRLYFLQGESRLAITLLTRAIEAKLINDSLAWNNLGFLYLMTDNLKKARIHFNSALQRKANNFLPTFNLALVNARQNKIKLAKQLIEKSLNLCKDDTIRDKLYLAIVKIALGKEKDDLQNLKNILETAKNSSLSLEQEVRCGVLESAQILAERPDFLGMKEAVNMLEQALQN